MKLFSVLRFFFSTLILVAALLVVFLHNGLMGFLLGILLVLSSYYLYAGVVGIGNFAGLFHQRSVRFDLIFDLTILTAAALTFHVFRTSSNVEFLFKQHGALLIRNESGAWEDLENYSGSLTPSLVYKNDNTSVYSLTVKREPNSLAQRLESYVNPNKLMIFEFLPGNDFLIFAETPHLTSVNAERAMELSQSNFVINSNFYGNDNNMLGELIIEGKRYGKQSRDATGFFRVIKGIPHVGAKSVLNNLPGRVEYSCQAMPSVIKNGAVFPYISQERGPYKPSWGRKTYRNLVGKKPNGHLVFMASNNGALLSVKEMATLAKLYGVHNASLFDGGAALQYRFENADFETSFSTFNNYLQLGQRIDQYIMRRYRINFSSKSPVYICVKETAQR